MRVVPDGGPPITHEVGHAAAHMYFGHGVDHISIRPDHGEHSGETKARLHPNDMSRYQRVVCFLAGPRAEQTDLTEDLERSSDLQNARSIVAEMVGAASEHEPEVDAIIRKAWGDAAEILDRTREFRNCAERVVRDAAPFAAKKHIDVEPCWNDQDDVGYRFVFSDSDRFPRQHVATVKLNGEDVGSITYGVDEGPAGVELVTLTNAEVPEQWRRRGHGKRIFVAIRGRHPNAEVADSPSSNSDPGEELLTNLRRHHTVHPFACYRNGNTCVCGAKD